MRSIALPLSVWILAAIALGVVTAWAIAIIFGLYRYWDTRDPRHRRNQRPLEPVTPPPPPGTRRTEPPLSRNNATVIQDDVPNRFNRTGETGSRIPVPNSSELEEENWIDEDEDFIDEPNAQSFPLLESVEGYNYEVVREPVAESWVGSSYSYKVMNQNLKEFGGIVATLPTMQTTKLSPHHHRRKIHRRKNHRRKYLQRRSQNPLWRNSPTEPPNSPGSSDDWTPIPGCRRDDW